MCFEASLRKTKEVITHRFSADFIIDLEYTPFFHLSGFTHGNLYIIPDEFPESIYPASWGYVPDWAMEDPSGFRKKYNTLNAKIETVMDSNTYKDGIRYNRCLIIVDGFFEPHQANGVSIPYFCYKKDDTYDDGTGLFAFAGFYSKLDAATYTCSILTMPANPFFAEIHNKKKRMPLILDKTFHQDWLDDWSDSQLNELMATSFSRERFSAHPVSRDLYKRNIDTNKPYIIQPVDKDTLF